MFQEIRVEPQRRGLLAIGFGRTTAPDNGLAQLRLGQWLLDRGIGADQLAGLDVDIPAIRVDVHLAAGFQGALDALRQFVILVWAEGE